MRDIRPIKSDADLEWALSQITPYFDAPPEDGTEEGDRFDVLTDLIEAYENRHFTIEASEPVEFLRSFMEMTGRSQADLAELLGSRSRASEIFGRKRALTIDMIFKLKEEWGIPADCLVRPYALVA
ncbi:MAG: XRE family transcriptional regulator [Rhizobium sp.]